jgi:hypothetical protein
MKKSKENYASLFGNNPDISLDERTRVINEIQKIGKLTFKISNDEEGWMAQCNEVGGIITGNTNPNPTNVEIESQIRDAIYAAFNVKIDKRGQETEFPFPFSFGYSHQSA